MRGRAFVVLAGLAALATVALIGGAVFKGGSHSAARYSKFSLTDPDSKAQTPGLGPGMTWDTYLQAADAYPAANVTPSEVANAEATFNALAASDAKHGDPKGGGAQWQQVGPQQDATQPGVTAFSGATNDTASRTASLLVAPDCGSKGYGKDCTRLGRSRRRRRLAHGQRDRRESGLEAAASRRPRPGFGRRARVRPDRQEEQDDLPGHG